MATSSAVPTIGGILSPNALNPVQIGQVLVDVGGNVWLPFNQATTNLGCQIGIAYSTSYPGNNIQVVIEGPIPYAVFNIGSGNGGTIVAGNVPGRGIGGQVIGTCDSSGSIIMWPSYVGTPQTVGSTTFGVVAGIGFNSAPPVAGQGFAFDGTRWNWLSILTAVSITGTGLAHVTGSTLDSTAFHGTADQLLVMNHAGSDTSFVTVGGDATYASGSWTTTGLQTTPVSATTPTTGQILRYNGSAWAPFTDAGTGFGSAGQYLLTNSGGSASTWVSMSGDVSSSVSTVGQTTVLAVNGATVPAAGALVTGHGLYVSGSSALSYSALNLAGGSGWVTGVLPIGNLPSLAGDCTGPITSNTVAAIQGVSVGAGVPGSNQGILFYSSHTNSYATFVPTGDISPGLTLETVGTLHVVAVNGATIPAAGSLTTGNSPYVSGSSALSYSALNLAGGSGWVTGSLPVGNIAHGTAAQVFITNSGATAPAWVSISGDSTTTAAGVWTNAKINGASVPAAGALTTGNGPYVSGASALTYSALNLGGGAGWVTGNLPVSNVAPGTSAQVLMSNGTPATTWTTITGDTTISATGVTTTAKINGITISGTPAIGNQPIASSTTAAAWGSLNLAGGANFVTGALPIANVAPGTSAQVLMSNATPATTWTTLTGDTTIGATGVTTTAKVNGSSVPAGGALTTGNVLQVTGVSALSYAAVNLAGGGNFVTGVLPAGNMAAQTLTGDVTGTTAANTVVQLTGSASSVSVIGGTGLTAVAGSGFFDFHVATGAFQAPTGNHSWAGASTKTLSLVASGAGATAVVDAGTSLSLGPTNATSVLLGNVTNTTAVTHNLTAAGVFSANNNGTTTISLGLAAGDTLFMGAVASGQMTLAPNALTWGINGTPITSQSIQTADAATHVMSFKAQSALLSAVTNVNGANMLLQSGAAASTANAGTRGAIRLQLGQDITETMLEVTEIVGANPGPVQRAVALARAGAGITATQLTSTCGDGVVWLGNAQTSPTGVAVGGALLFAKSANLWAGANFGVSVSGTTTPLFDVGITTASVVTFSALMQGSSAASLPLGFQVQSAVTVTSGATLSAAQYANPIILLTGTLAAGQTVTLPNKVGSVWFFDLQGVTLGAFTLTFSTGSGTTAGVVAATLASGQKGVVVAITASNVVTLMS